MGAATSFELPDLVAACIEQRDRFLRGEPSDDGPGLELFRRAIVLGESDARTWIVDLYRPLLLPYALRRAALLVDTDVDLAINGAFERFWRATRPGRFEQFVNLAAILKYLKLCLGSVLLDETRARRRQAEVALSDIPPDPLAALSSEASGVGRLAARELWQTIDEEVTDENERVVARLSFADGLSPREILARHPERFSDVFDVYRAKRNVIGRLRRSAAFAGVLDSGTRTRSRGRRSPASEGKGPPRDNAKRVAGGQNDDSNEAITWVRGTVSEQSSVQTDLVDCSLYAPTTLGPGQTCLVQVVLHLADQARLARRLALEFDPDASRRGVKTLETTVERGTRLEFRLSLPGAVVDEPFQLVTWRGVPISVQFTVIAPATAPREPLTATVVMSLGGVPVGHIKFRLPIRSPRTHQVDERPRRVGDSARFYRRAFVSYAAVDRSEVLKRLQILQVMHVPFVQDVLSLSPGDDWDQRLARAIENSDLFLLFWSSSARSSKRVLREIRYAIRCKHGDDAAPPEILPVPIEGPPPVPPPPGLQHLHFNDFLLYFIR